MNVKKTILIIEDDTNISCLLELYLVKEGYKVIFGKNGEEGLEKFYDNQPDLVLLDIMMPKMDGWEVLKNIRLDDQKTPIIMLTGKGEMYDKIKGLEQGADDYIVKPFEPKEVLARMKAVWRRTNPQILERDSLYFKNFELDINRYRLVRRDEQLVFPPKELELLFFLASNSNFVFTRQQLVEQIWGYDYEGDVRTVDVHIKRIREKIGDELPAWQLKTIRGIGYKFEVNEHD